MDFDIIKIIVTTLVAFAGWYLVHYLNSERDLQNKRRQLRITYLLDAYRRLERAGNRKNYKDYSVILEETLADIQLLGTAEQVLLAQKVIKDLENAQSASLNQLLNEIRDDLRNELQIGKVSEPLVFLRIDEVEDQFYKYVGNVKTMEVHDRIKAKGKCPITKIPKEHKVGFSSLEEAKAKGFDVCAFCILS